MEDEGKDDTSSSEEEEKKYMEEMHGGKKKRKNKEPEWTRYGKMDLKEKRKLYKCGNDFVPLKNIETWTELFYKETYISQQESRVPKPDKCAFPFNKELNDKVSLWTGDITTLEIDAIVNAANCTLLGGGGVDGCIHRAAGPSLKLQCRLLDGCDTGQAKLTLGHKLPAKYILHTVGPIGEQEDKLESCYKSCLELCLEHNIRTVAFCCISTGIFGYPNEKAADVALRTSRQWLEENKDAIDRIIFCLFMDVDIEVYHSLMLKYYPPTPPLEDTSQNEQSKDQQEDKPEKRSKKLKQDNNGSDEQTSKTAGQDTSKKDQTEDDDKHNDTPQKDTKKLKQDNNGSDEKTSKTAGQDTSKKNQTEDNDKHNDTPQKDTKKLKQDNNGSDEKTSKAAGQDTSEKEQTENNDNTPDKDTKKLKQDKIETGSSDEQMKTKVEDNSKENTTTATKDEKLPSKEKQNLASTEPNTKGHIPMDTDEPQVETAL